MINIKISVRKLIESVLRAGDIDDSYRSRTRMLDGTLAHQKVQREYGEDYKAEFVLKTQLDYEDFRLKIEGRADGIYRKGQDIFIEEIKSTNLDLEKIGRDFNLHHWAQVKFYGHMYMEEEGLDKIVLRLTYFQLESEEKKHFEREYKKEELESYFYNIVARYVDWARTSFYWVEKRNKSIGQLKFPFKEYREGQREMAVAVYKTIEEGKKIYIQAPTGIGKTMSTVFPALKSMGQGQVEKIFYLTGKTISRQSPIKAYEILKNQGLDLKLLGITSKEKICLNNDLSCNPKDCKYAKGHFNRVNEAIRDIFEGEDLFSREVILSYSKKHQVCPFEFSLDLADFADLVVGDYNYLFDPQVRLKRFFELAKGDYVFLIDEVHNLIDRARDMYSTSLFDKDILDLGRALKANKKIYKSLNKIVNAMDIIKTRLDLEDSHYQEDYLDDLVGPINRTISLLDKFLVEDKEDKNYDRVLDLYFDLVRYIKLSDFYDEHFYMSLENKEGGTEFKINCMDPSRLIRKTINKGRASVMFSATLWPMDYYMDLLGGTGKDYHMVLQSPFPQENFLVSVVPNISTKYKDREFTYLGLVAYIESFIRGKEGNYLIFFPSYKYMEEVYEIFLARNPNIRSIIQARSMDEEAREEFLGQFQEGSLVAFAVMGGIFSEGIDLVGESLIGAVIVGVGLPMVCFENNMLKDYYNNYFPSGFDYAYTYPGMNKVLQAAGRVIRSESDKGALLLIDTRYGGKKYRELFPKNWYNYKEIRSKEDLEVRLNKFWQ